MVDVVNKAENLDYCDNPILRLIGDIKDSPVLEKVVSAKELSSRTIRKIPFIALTNFPRLTGNVSSWKRQKMSLMT